MVPLQQQEDVEGFVLTLITQRASPAWRTLAEEALRGERHASGSSLAWLALAWVQAHLTSLSCSTITPLVNGRVNFLSENLLQVFKYKKMRKIAIKIISSLNFVSNVRKTTVQPIA